MKNDNSYRFTEKCLYNYNANLSRLEALNSELLLIKSSGDVRAQSYEHSSSHSGAYSDPVANHLLKIETLEHKISETKRVTLPISRLIHDLNSEHALDGSRNSRYRAILELFYFAGNKVNVILERLDWSKTSFYVLKHRLVLLAKDYLGL